MCITRCNRQYAERLRNEIRDFLRENCGLELSAEKTRITHVRDGYDFLGFNISTGVGRSGKVVPKIKVGRKAIAKIQTRLGEALRYRPMQESISVRLTVIRRSSVDGRTTSRSPTTSGVAHGLDHRAFWIATKAICRKEDISTAKCLRKYGRNAIGVHEDVSSPSSRIRDRRITIRRRNRISPAVKKPYLEDDEWEAAFVLHNRRRPGCGDLKWEALVRDGFHCRGCGVTVTSKTSHADHIEPVNRFANLDMANSLDNIQTLCHWCHKLKTARDK